MKDFLLNWLSLMQSCYLRLYFSQVRNRGFFKKTSLQCRTRQSSISVGVHSHLDNCKFEINSPVTIEIGDYSRLENVHFKIFGGMICRIEIGSLCQVKNVTFWIEDNGGSVTIGDRTYIGGAHLAVTGSGKKITIGNDCMFSDGITIRTGDSHAIIEVTTGRKLNPEEDVIVGNHVWLTQNVTILKGASIGDDCIVGTGSVVSGKFAENSVLSGIPAKVMKSGVTWSSERVIS